MWLRVAVLLLQAAFASSESIWKVGRPQGHVEVREDLPSPGDFFREYLRNVGGPFDGVGKPVLLRGAARRMPAYSLWTDDYLRARYGGVIMDQVETEKKETRTAYPHDNWTLSRFLNAYNTSEIYSTAVTPEGLSDEVYLLPPMNCGGFLTRMSSTVLWMSSGGTKSVIHNDQQQNFHCMIAGEKEWIFWHPKSRINTSPMGWVHAEEEAATDPAFKDAYGAYAGRINVDNVDLKKFPGWDKLHWWRMTLSQGDCAFIPSRWFHYVEAPAQRSISVHVWFQNGKSFDEKSCQTLETKGFNVSDYLVRLSDCTWGFGEDGNKKKTKCRFPGEAHTVQSRRKASKGEL